MKHESGGTGLDDERYWTKLTDDQLLDAVFRVDDPTSLPDVILELPDGAEVPTVELAYNTKASTGRKVRCVHCRHEHHFRGFVLRFQDGRRMLVGKDCGSKIYGADFDLLERDFNGARDRASYIRRQRAVQSAAPGFIAHLQSLLRHPSLNAFRTLRSEFLRKLPELASLAADACYRYGGDMMFDEKVRDFAAEERRDQRADLAAERIAKMTKTERRRAIENRIIPRLGSKPKPIHTFIAKSLGQIQGQLFFRTKEEAPGAVIGSLILAIKTTIGKLSGERLTNTQYRSIFANLGDQINAIEREIERLESPLDAFEFRHLSLIADWANRRAKNGGVYKAEIGAIAWSNPDGDQPVTVRCPADYRPPSRQPIKAFRAVASGL